MGSKKSTLIQGIRAFLILCALTFTTNIHALTSGGGDRDRDGDRDREQRDRDGDREREQRDRDGDRTHSHFRGCGHDSDSQGGGDSIPLDGGLGILLVGAAVFGIRKLRGRKNEKI